jgi:hypothetical protein
MSAGRTAGSDPSPVQRETLSLDQGWRFHLGDIPLAAFGDSGGLAFGPPDITDSDAKSGATWGAGASHFNDRSWRQLDLPHDWEDEQPFDRQANKSEGYRQRGIAWYRRQFRLDPSGGFPKTGFYIRQALWVHDKPVLTLVPHSQKRPPHIKTRRGNHETQRLS